MKLNKLLKPVKRFMLENSSQILTGLEIAGYFTAGVMAVKATPKAMQALEDKKYDERKERLTVWETIKTAGPYYIPAGVVAAGATGAAIGRCIKDQRKQAFLATAVSAAEATNRELLEKAKEVVGEEKVKEIKEKIAEEKIEKTISKPDEAVIEITGKGNDLFYEYESGRIFRSTMEEVLRAKDSVNERLYSYDELDLNEFYTELGLDPTGFGNDHYWSIEDSKFINVNISAAKILSNGLLAYVIDYDGRLRTRRYYR